MSSVERMRAVLAGIRPDHAPVSFWHHFSSGCYHGRPAVDVHLAHLSRYKLDFLKVMNDNGYPTRLRVESARDLKSIPVLGGDEGGFARQLELIRTLSDELHGEVLLTTTVFNAWTVLRRIVTPPTTDKHNPPELGDKVSPVDARLTELIQQDRAAVASALEVIAASLAAFATRCIEAGAKGIFMSVRDDWVDTEANGLDTYDTIVRPGDLRILTAASEGSLNVLHVCGSARGFDAFAGYPVHVINWADRAAGPAIADVAGRVKPVICGGVDNLGTLPHGTAEDVRAEAEDALRQAGNHPMILSAGCTFDPESVPSSNLVAIVDAARAKRR